MKKFIVLLAAIFMLTTVCACSENDKTFERISQLREDIFYYGDEEFSLYAYPELRENPFVEDGYAGKTDNYIIFKLTTAGNKEPIESPTVYFELNDKIYTKQFDFLPLAVNLYCQVDVDELPVGNFSVTIKFNGTEKDINFESLKKNSTFSYKDIINLAKQCNNITVKDFFENPDNYELRLRLIENSGFNYWYVGISGENSVALLYDGETGELIAVKDN